MPFTLAHPALVLPLRGTALPTTALVAGSMAPDARLFVPVGPDDLSHSLVGVLTVDLVLGLGLLALWTWVVRDVLVDLAPGAVRDRLAVRSRLDRARWLLAVPATVVGAATHVGWDELTHADRWGTRHVDWLREEHWFWPGYTWAQAASGVVGLVVVLVAAVGWLRARPLVHRPQRRVLPRPTLLAVGAVVGVLGLLAGLDRLAAGVEPAAHHWVVTTLRLAALAAAATCALWWTAYAVRGRGAARPSLEQ